MGNVAGFELWPSQPLARGDNPAPLRSNLQPTFEGCSNRIAPPPNTSPIVSYTFSIPDP
ncbi:hypothetical protein RHMOL_Rhmol04G0290800 [Rhododendron molle]|uniref:Uncharacterized protein n=1 Tax=Rhododendron molle TaxID=49168 RepID=A0ACC0P6V1_RHOML|nr:hypothetical protein RHMOL_Rhmol04G0290800 [Rhododendron molle]